MDIPQTRIVFASPAGERCTSEITGDEGKQPMKCVILAACAGLLGIAAGHAEIRGDAIKVGVLNDMSGVYSGNGGAGSVVAAQLAAEDFGGAIDGKPIIILQADDQNKPDIGTAIARQWYDRDGVLAIADLVPSTVAVGVEDLVRQNHKIALISGASSESMFQENCAATAFTWVQDTYSIANGTVDGVSARAKGPWFFINTDLAPSLQLERQAHQHLGELGGTIAGSVKAPFDTMDYSSFLLQAQSSGAKVLAINTLGGTTTTVKQAVEFGLTRQMALVLTTPKSQDIIAMGLPTAQGQLLVTSFYEDVSPAARSWTNRFMARTKKLPTEVQAGVYSSIRHLLAAVKDSNSDDGATVAAKMRATPVSDAYTTHGEIRADGRLIHDMYLMQVKTPAESKDPQTDIWTQVGVIAPEHAFPPLTASRCKLVHPGQ
jgi:ABC-type branched-subunit amino acid transport system substrate-binding protein